VWNVLRDWLLLNTVLRGPEDTRRKVHTVANSAATAGRTAVGGVPVAIRVVWWGLVVFCAVVGGTAALQGDGSAALGGVVVIGILVALRLASRLVRRPAA
jgi:hypothetical protein